MKQIIFLLITFFTFSSCRYITGSGNIVSETRKVENFDGISVGGSFEVEVKIGDVTEVIVEADDNIIKYIKTSVSGNILKIRTEDLHNYSDVHMKIFITTPALNEIKASASAGVMVKDVLVSKGKLSFNASSAGSIKAAVDAPEIETDASSGATVNVSGKTKIYTAKASSGANMKTNDLLSEITTVKTSSGASAHVHASVNLNAAASSGSSITYHGAATVNNSVSSGANIVKKD